MSLDTPIVVIIAAESRFWSKWLIGGASWLQEKIRNERNSNKN